MPHFLITGGTPLCGKVHVSGSKNAALPIMAACLLTKETCTLTNVPDIADVHTMVGLLQYLGAEVDFTKNTLRITAKNLKNRTLTHELVKKLRASILLLGPLLARFGEAKIAYPGGCVLGKRPVSAHFRIMEDLGATVTQDGEEFKVKASKGLKGVHTILEEASVTGTENAIMAATGAEGRTTLRWTAMEPHVQDLCVALVKMGAKIEGIGTATLRSNGPVALHGIEHAITADYLEAGTFALAAVLTDGDITITGVVPEHLDSFWQKLQTVGAELTFTKDTVRVRRKADKKLYALQKLQTAVYPGFPTDLQAPFAVLLTQAEGETQIFETLFEGRLNYIAELQKLGAVGEIKNSHQATVQGPSRFTAAPINSCDIRAGAAMVLAALVAQGTTEIHDINYIDRGYENFDQKLTALGAKIVRT